MTKYFIGNNIFNDYGYLVDYTDWNVTLAFLIAKNDDLFLLFDHWYIIFIVRSFYLKNFILPNYFLLVKLLKINYYNFTYTSIDLLRLFPKGLLIQSAKISGLPKPNTCFLG